MFPDKTSPLGKNYGPHQKGKVSFLTGPPWETTKGRRRMSGHLGNQALKKPKKPPGNTISHQPAAILCVSKKAKLSKVLCWKGLQKTTTLLLWGVFGTFWLFGPKAKKMGKLCGGTWTGIQKKRGDLAGKVFEKQVAKRRWLILQN